MAEAMRRVPSKAGNAVDRQVGDRVRMRRRLVGLSQQKLADAIGVSFNQLQKYEKGANRITSSRLQQIAEVLGVGVAFFFAPGLDVPQEPSGADDRSVGDLLARQDTLRLLRAFAMIDDSALRARLVDLVEHLSRGVERRSLTDGSS